MFVDFLGSECSTDCMGCSLANGSYSPPGGILFQSQYFHVNQDPLVPLNGFLVITANRHIQNIGQMTDPEFSDFSAIFRKTKQIIHDVCGIKYLTTVQEDSSRHFHTWFFPWNDELLEKYEKPGLPFIREIMGGFIGSGIGTDEWAVLQKTLEIISKKLHESA